MPRGKRRIGTITPLWNQELFIKPHFEMLKDFDRNLVLIQERPLPSYRENHGYSIKPDLSVEILKTQFPNVELQKAMYPPELDFTAGLYNEGLLLMQDCDLVLRLDPDMLWNKRDWKAFVEYLYSTDFDCYRMDFAKDSVNYYETRQYHYGLKDAMEMDALAVDPKTLFTGVLDYSATNPVIINLGNNWTCHHWRGWNKPKSTPQGWHKTLPSEYLKKYGNNGNWFRCPDEIKNTMEEWLEELDILKGIK